LWSFELEEAWVKVGFSTSPLKTWIKKLGFWSSWKLKLDLVQAMDSSWLRNKEKDGLKIDW
jgi:hypothetical protein